MLVGATAISLALFSLALVMLISNMIWPVLVITDEHIEFRGFFLKRHRINAKEVVKRIGWERDDEVVIELKSGKLEFITFPGLTKANRERAQELVCSFIERARDHS